MRSRKPPRLATWLMDRLGYSRRNEALAGDLLEEFASGRSAAWFWRQTLMVIAGGAVRNVAALRVYLAAVVLGYAVQVPAVLLLWKLRTPAPVHGAGREILAGLMILAAFFLLSLAKASTVGEASADLRLLVCTAGGGPGRHRTLAWISLETFLRYLLCYCVCAVYYRLLSLPELAGVELEWLLLFELIPAVFRPLAARRAEPAAASQSAPECAWPPQESGLPVALRDGRTVVLARDTVVQTAFAAADEELTAALFRNASALESLRRAIWLGSTRGYLRSLTRSDREVEPGLDAAGLAALIDEAAKISRP